MAKTIITTLSKEKPFFIYSFPELGIVVEASTLDEANEKVKELSKNIEASKNISIS